MGERWEEIKRNEMCLDYWEKLKLGPLNKLCSWFTVSVFVHEDLDLKFKFAPENLQPFENQCNQQILGAYFVKGMNNWYKQSFIGLFAPYFHVYIKEKCTCANKNEWNKDNNLSCCWFWMKVAASDSCCVSLRRRMFFFLLVSFNIHDASWD